MNGIIYGFCFTLAISVPPIVLKWCRKEHKKIASEERVTAKSKPIINLISQYSVRDPNVLASTASENPRKTKSESQNVPLSSLKCAANKNRETCVGRQLIKPLRMEHWRQVVFSSLEIWWNVEHKNGEFRRWQVCHRWWYGLWHRRRIEPLSKITFILEQGEWSSAKDAGPFFKRCNTRQQQTFFNMVNVYVFDIGSICIHGQEIPRQCTFHQNTGDNLTMKQMFDISEKW